LDPVICKHFDLSNGQVIKDSKAPINIPDRVLWSVGKIYVDYVGILSFINFGTSIIIGNL
jgi:hypothetical protein